MRLKSLELQGFKSFPDRTKLSFDTGMTVVIGPNGSGKSNIADAIRWVLGELSSKNIRGTKMEDVIFGGTDNRRPMGYAEVSLTFDNTEGEIALPVSYDEVTVTRKYYRSGDSEYMINGQNVRLRDITELFMNTGIGKSGYSVIGQGRISEIVSKKSEDRRGIFEEAAGISKYRARKSEAERKLERTDDNLSRVNDILTELGSRVGPLEKDAEKARKYLEIFAEKKEVDVGLWLYEIDSVRVRSEKLIERYEITKHELEIAEDSLATLDRQTELLFERMRENQEKSENTYKETMRVHEEKHRSAAAISILERDDEHLKNESARIESEIEKKNAEGAEQSARLEKLAQTRSDLNRKSSLFEKALIEKQAEIDELRTTISLNAKQLDEAEEAVEAAKTALQELRLEKSGLEGSKTSEAQRKKELEEQLSDLSLRVKKSGEALLEAEKTLSEYKKKSEEIKEKIAGIDEKIKNNAERASINAKKENEVCVALDTTNARIRLLRQMEEHFEGYSGAVRHIMNKASKNELRGICGPVSKLITVKEEYATAFEVTLGAALQHIVTEDEIAAKAAIEELKISKNGRATFYPLNTVTPQNMDVDKKKLSEMSGYIGRAHELCSFDKKYDSVMRYLLGRTVISRTLEDASAIARAFSYRFKVVSLDGQVVNAGGSFTGGSLKREGGILSRSAEIERLEKEKEEKTALLADCEKESSILSKKAAELQSDKDAETQTFEILQVMYNSADTDCKVRKAGLENDAAQKSATEDALCALREEMKGFNSRKAEIEERIAQAVSLTAQKQVYCDKLAQEGQLLEEDRSKKIEEKNALLIEKGSIEKDLMISARESEEATLRIALLYKESEELKEETKSIKEKRTAQRQKKIEEELRLKALEEQLETLSSEDESLKSENESFEKQSAEIRRKQKEKNAHRETLLRDYTKLDAAIEAIKSEQERYSAKLWDEYELTYAASKELGYPEVTEETRAITVQRQNKLKNRLRELGSVNVGAIEEYAEVKERFDELSKQWNDLSTARTELNSVISDLEKEMRTRFAEIFSQINDNFRVVFAELFGGGTAELSLTDPENILESGIEISVAPPGKIIKSLSLLSGGEQVFVAIAIFFAILRVTPAPFCLLDEIEAALDEVNVARFASYAKAYSDKTQFIIITHRRGTMEEADTMYGITMSERGISKVMPLHFEEVEKKTGIKL